jgi:hypothetical protein
MPSIAQLKKALQIAEQIHSLQAELDSLLGGGDHIDNGLVAAEAETTAPARKKGRKKGSKMSPEGRARIAAAQRARWAKARGGR